MSIRKSLSTGDLRPHPPETADQQKKVVLQSVLRIEEHFPQLVDQIGYYATRTAKLRNAGDRLQKSLATYAQKESPSLRQGLLVVAEAFSAVQNCRDTLVTCLDRNVLNAFSAYQIKCQQARSDLKSSSLAVIREQREHQSFERVSSRRRNTQSEAFNIAQAEARLRKASLDADRSVLALADQMSQFEREKAKDAKRIFGEMLSAEIYVCAKSLEHFSKAFQCLMSVNEDQDASMTHDAILGDRSELVDSSSNLNPDVKTQSASVPNLMMK